MVRPDDAEYYVAGRTEHVSQGDIFSDVSFEMPGLGIGVPTTFGILLTYTSGMMNQPPGSRGYKHPFRLVAPLVPLTLLPELGVSDNNVERIRREDPFGPYMYLPPHPPEFEESTALIFRPVLVLQDHLGERVTQLQLPAARRLQIKIFTTYLGGNPSHPDEDLNPDMSDHWNDY